MGMRGVRLEARCGTAGAACRGGTESEGGARGGYGGGLGLGGSHVPWKKREGIGQDSIGITDVQKQSS